MRRLLPGWLHWPQLDLPLLAGLLVLMGGGLLVLYSASGGNTGLWLRQAVRLGVAVAAMLVLAQVPARFLRILTPAIYAAGVLLLVVVAGLGDIGKGAQRWLDLGFVRFQPSEIMKLAVPMMCAWYLHDRALPASFGETLVVLAIILVPAVLIFEQPDLGTALLVMAAGVYVLFFAGLPWKWLAALGAAGLAALPLAWTMMHDYQRTRVLTLIDPTTDPLGKGFHTLQATIAIGAGGAFGKGWMQGTQTHLEFIPERTSDFIFAVFSEEFGLVGNVVLMLLFLALVARALLIAMNASTTFSRLLAGSIALIIFTYAFVNMGMVSGILPVVGVPLPFVSYGGTALVTLGLACGMLMSVNRHRKLVQS